MHYYERTGSAPEQAQGLQLAVGGKSYRVLLYHAGVDIVRDERRGRKRPARVAHTHDDIFHIVLVTDGQVEFVTDGRPLRVRPGLLVLSQPGDWHYFAPVTRGRMVFSEITFTFRDPEGRPLGLDFLALLSAYSGVPLQPAETPVALDSSQTSELRALFRQLLHALGKQYPLASLDAQQIVGQIFVFLIREVFSDRSDTQYPSLEIRLAETHAYIETHYREPTTVAALARRAHVSPGYFLRAFKRAYGIQPLAYRRRLRMEAAKVLLHSSSLGCDEIAARLGYGNVYHFSKDFRKLAGMSPTIYRKDPAGSR